MGGHFRDHFRALARHNAWANARLYEACGRLPEAEYFKSRAAVFGSIHGVLNHILVCDRLWLARLEGRDSGISSLDQKLYGDFAGLKVARVAEDARIIGYVDGLDEEDLGAPLGYHTLDGTRLRDPLHFVLATLFSHQVHHRGQAHGLLSQTEVAPPSLDLIVFLREAPGDDA